MTKEGERVEKIMEERETGEGEGRGLSVSKTD